MGLFYECRTIVVTSYCSVGIFFLHQPFDYVSSHLKDEVIKIIDEVIYLVSHDSRLSDSRLFSSTWPYVVLPSVKYVEFVSILCIHAVCLLLGKIMYGLLFDYLEICKRHSHLFSNKPVSGCHSLCATSQAVVNAWEQQNNQCLLSFSCFNVNKNWSVVKSIYLLPFFHSTRKIA